MCDPAADGASRDIWTSSIGSVDVHYSSGVPNLMFCLLSKGGTHPRGKTTTNVPAQGMDKAVRIVYKAQVDILTSNSNMAAARTAMINAASQLGYDQATQDAVGCAWAAVGVGTAPTTCGGTNPPPPPPPPMTTPLTNGVPVTGLSGASGATPQFSIAVPAGQSSLTITTSGGTGDADMHVNFGSAASTTTYQCRPYKNGNAETCTFTPPQAGTYYIMLHGYTAYSGVTLTATYSATTGGDPVLQNGVPVTSISGASGSNKYWRINKPAGSGTMQVRISGGTGDADLYTRVGSRPTTSTYACRPYLNGNNETCTHTAAGEYYVMLRGYTAYSGVTLVASY
jgi:vibriolysin